MKKKKKWTYSVALDDIPILQLSREYHAVWNCTLANTSNNILFCRKTTKIKFDTKYKELGFTLDDN